MNQDAVAVVVINDVQFVSNWRRGRCQQRPRDRRRETKACLPIHCVVKSQIDGRGQERDLTEVAALAASFRTSARLSTLTLFVVVALVKYFEIGCSGTTTSSSVTSPDSSILLCLSRLQHSCRRLAAVVLQGRRREERIQVRRRPFHLRLLHPLARSSSLSSIHLGWRLRCGRRSSLPPAAPPVLYLEGGRDSTDQM